MPHSKNKTVNPIDEPENENSIELLPEINQFIQIMEQGANSLPDSTDTSPVAARANAEVVRQPLTQGGPQMAKTQELLIPYKAASIRVRIYYPSDSSVLPGFFYLHGGGWVLFSLDTHDRVMREYAHDANVCVIGIDYSLAPEHKYPYQIEEISHAVKWCYSHAKDLAIDPTKLVMGGDSAGANLSTAVALVLKQQGQNEILKGLILNYGAFDANFTNNQDSKSENKEILLTSEEMVWFWEQYLQDKSLINEHLVSPINADLIGLPSTFMVISEYDVLHDENIRMRDQLRNCNVTVKANVYAGTTHSFLESVSLGGVAETAIKDTALWLQQIFSMDESNV